MTRAFVIEKRNEDRHLIATGAWSKKAEREMTSGKVDGLVLNYARGFEEPNLEFLAAWPVRHLQVLDRTITDLTPITRLAHSLESLMLEAATNAELDLSVLRGVRQYVGTWPAIEASVHWPDGIEEITLLDYDEMSLRPLCVQPSLRRVTLNARFLQSLDGIDEMPNLIELCVFGARELDDLSPLAAVADSLEQLEFETCLGITSLDAFAALTKLSFVGVNDCGRIASLQPLRGLVQLRVFLAWGSTRIEDADLSPLLDLPNLAEVRMRERREYTPSVAEVRERARS
jgi:hypothetical protein